MGRGDRRGVNQGRSFAEVFGDLADGEDLAELREKFAAKAFQRRQEAVLLGLRELGWADAAIVAMDLAALDAVAFATGEAAASRPRYRALLLDRGLAAQPGDLAFRSLDGEPLTAERAARPTSPSCAACGSTWSSTARCAGAWPRPATRSARRAQEPTLVDFMLGPRAAPADDRR